MTNHNTWKEREKELLLHAKRIYQESANFDSSIDLESAGDEIYDLMNEEDWQKFRLIEKKIKEKYSQEK